MDRTDLRVIKTRERIEEQLLLCLKEMPFHEITVSLLIQRSRINRSTFYRNYEDKYALLDAVEKPLLQELHDLLDPPFILIGYENAHEFSPQMQKTLAFFKAHHEKLSILWKAELPHSFMERTADMLTQLMCAALDKYYPLSPQKRGAAKLHGTLSAAHLLIFMHWWIENGMHLPENQLLSMMDGVMEHGLFFAMEDYYGKGPFDLHRNGSRQ